MKLLKKGLWVIVLIALLVSIPSLVERVQVEQENQPYEVVMPYEHFVQWSNLLDDSLSEEEILQELKGNGLTSMSIEPITVSQLVQEGVFDRKQKSEIEHEHPEAVDELPEKNGQFLQVLKTDSPFVSLVENVYNNHYAIMTEEGTLSTNIEVSFYEYGDDLYVFLPYELSLGTMPIGFDPGALQLIDEAGLNIIPRFPNRFSAIQNEEHYVYEMLEDLAVDYGATALLFSGPDVVGSNAPDDLRMFASKVREFDYSVVQIDFGAQRGMEAFLRVGDLKESTIRLFSMTLGKGTERQYAGEVEKGLRGYKERNIRMMFVNPLAGPQVYTYPGEAEQGLEYTNKMISELTTGLGKEQLGQAKPFTSFSQPTLVTYLVLLGAAALIALTGFAVHRYLGVLAGLGSLALVAASIVLNMDIALKGLALLTAISAAVYAGLAVGKITGWKQLLVQYGQSIAIALTGAWLVIGMLYGPAFLVKIDEFRGVKVLAALPVLLVGLVLFASFLRSLLHEPVRYWHLVLMLFVAGILGFYVMRTGNAAVTLPYELEFRNFLESVLYARPRTSEFLIGFPLFVLGLYLRMREKKAAPLFLTVGMIGFASMVGTFTHLHTPLLISILRSSYGIVFGFVIGLIFIQVYRAVERYLFPEVQKRWKL